MLSFRTPLPPVEMVGQTTFMGITWAFVVISFLLLLFRLVVRVRTARQLQIDDYLVIAGWFMFLSSTVCFQVYIPDLYMEYAYISGKVAITPEVIDGLAAYFPQLTTWTTLYYMGLWFIKFSFLFFFRQLGDRVRLFQAWWWLVFGVTVVTLAICIGIEDYKCSVTGLEYIFAHCNEDAHIITQNGIIYGTAAIDIFTDLLILSLPFLILRGVTMPRKYKAILYGIFSLTVIVITVAVVRCIELKASQHSEIQIHSIDWLFLWSNIELGVAISVSCLSSFRQLFVFHRRNTEAGGLQPSNEYNRPGWVRSHLSFLASKSPSKERSRSIPWSRSERDMVSNSDTIPLNSVRVDKTVDVAVASQPMPRATVPHQGFRGEHEARVIS